MLFKPASVGLFAATVIACSSDVSRVLPGGAGGAGGADAVGTGASMSTTATTATSGGAGGAASWQPVAWPHGCPPGRIEVATPEVVEALVPPLTWEPCTSSVPCQKWKLLFESGFPPGIGVMNVHRIAGQSIVSAILAEKTYQISALFDVASGKPLAAWRTIGPWQPTESCSLHEAIPDGDGVWIGTSTFAANFDDKAWYVHHHLPSSAFETVPFAQHEISQARRGANDIFVIETMGKQLLAWKRPDGEQTDLTTTGVSDRDASITSHGIFFKHAPEAGASEVWHWDPESGEARHAAQVPPGTGALHVIAGEKRLWWTVGMKNPNGSGFTKIDLFTASLPLVGPWPVAGTFVAELDLDIADAAASEDRFVYHDQNSNEPQVFRMVSLNGNETIVALPSDTNTITALKYTGYDGELDHSLWFFSGKGTYRLSLPP
jgi:hypothetical protein